MEKQETQIDNLKLNKQQQQEKKLGRITNNATDTVSYKNENDPVNNKQKRNKKPEMVRYQPPNSRLSKSDAPTPVVNKIDEIEEKVFFIFKLILKK